MLMKNFDSALKQVKNTFPFSDYITIEYEVEMKSTLKVLENFVEKNKKYRLLDIGCGPLDKTALFQFLGFECYAVDDLNDPWHHEGDNIKKIIDYAKNIGINFYKQGIDDYSIPFDTKFDIVTCFAVMEHLHSSPKYILNTIGEFLVDDGILVISVPNSVALYQRLKVLFGYSNYPRIDLFYNSIGNWRGHVREYTLDELVYVVNKNNFKILTAQNFDTISYKKFIPPMRWFYNFLVKLIPKSGSVNLVIAKKPSNWKPKLDDKNEYIQSIKSAIPKGALESFNK